MKKAHLMKKAHEIAKGIVNIVGDYTIALSMSLKEVWRLIKKYNKKRMGQDATQNAIIRLTTTKEEKRVAQFVHGLIPYWIINKNLSNEEAFAVMNYTQSCDVAISRETEKAVLFGFITDFGTVKMWCPKSVLNKGQLFNELFA